MDLHPTEEQTALANMAKSALGDYLPIALQRQDIEAATTAAWPRLAELGLFGIMAPMECGGVGLAATDAVLLCEEAGRCHAPIALALAVVAADLAARANREDICSAIAMGNAQVGCSLRLREKTVWLGPQQPDYVLGLENETSTLLRTERVDVHLPCLDPLTFMVEASAGAEPAAVLYERRSLELTRLLVAALLSGNAQATLNIAVEHAKLREQFGKPIGAFQAIRHVCAEMARRVEAAQSVTRTASVRFVEQDSGLSDWLAAACVTASDAARANAAETLQILGALGMTSDHDLHLYLKRGHLLDMLITESYAPELELART